MKPIAHLIGAAFGDMTAVPSAPARCVSSGTCSRRKKLWELPAQRHCVLIGTCLPVAEMRKLAARAGVDAQDMSDYSLHAVVTGHCDERGTLAELIQRWLEKRHVEAIRRFGRAKDAGAVLFAWREALAQGQDIAGALWAAWTHPLLNGEDAKEIFGDIHMLSHQVGASARADLRQLEQLTQENAGLRKEMQALRLGLGAAQRERETSADELRRRLADAEQRAALLPHRELELAEMRKAAGNHRAVLERAEVLAARVERLEERNAALARNAAVLARDLNEAQDSLAAAEAALEMALGVCDGSSDDISGAGACGRACPAETALAGRCVLCIGGRTGMVDGYRRLVEHRGGRFAHHDGGQEESLHRIDAAVAAADAVVCQAGCVSHAAYFRLKEACKKLGKPCVFVQSPGVGSFARGLAVLGGEAPTGNQITLLAG
jgi:regulator of replication initiation timing